MIAWKLAARLAFSRDRRQRWRQFSVAFGVFVSCLAALLGVGLVHASMVGLGKQEARGIKYEKSTPAIKTAQTFSFASPEYQFPIVWLEPLPGFEDDPRLIPPGLTRLPEPGAAVLSPGLIADGFSAKDFGFASSAAGGGSGGAIGPAGLETLSEHYIYARPALGRTLEEEGGGKIFGTVGFNQQPITRGWRVLLHDTQIGFSAIPQLLSPFRALLLAIILCFFPALYLLFGAVRAMSPVRRNRVQRLWELGISRRKILGVLALESGCLAVIGIFGAFLTWWLWLSKVQEFPLAETTMVPGALTIPLPMLLGVATAGISLALIAGCAGAISPRKARSSSKRFSPWRALPLVAAAALFLSVKFAPIPQRDRGQLLDLGLVLALIAMPISIPGLVSWVAHRIRSPKDIALWLASKRLTLKSTQLTRPAAVVGALVLISGAAVGLAKSTSDMTTVEANERRSFPFTAMGLSWEAAKPQDFAAIENSVPGYEVLPVAKTSKRFAFIKDCAQAQRVAKILNTPACVGGKLSPAFDTAIRQIAESRALLGAPPKGTVQRALILNQKRVPEIEVLRQLPPGLAAWRIANFTSSSGTFAQLGWMFFIFSIGSCTLMIALLRELGDRSLLALADSAQLRGLPLYEGEIRSVNRWILSLPLALAIPIGYGLSIMYSKAGVDLRLSTANLALVSLSALVAALLSMAVFWAVTQVSEKYLVEGS